MANTLTGASVNLLIEENIVGAEGGSQKAAEQLYQGILAGPLYVPDRYQKQPMSDAPKYPGDFTSILGVQDKERVVVPAFSRVDYIEQWCGNLLAYKVYDGLKLFSIVPAGWWIVLNSGCEIQKELSPWEIDQLRGGSQGIPAVIEELFSDREAEMLQIREIESNDHVELKRVLCERAQNIPEILQLFLMREEGRGDDDSIISAILIGALINSSDGALRDRIKAELKSAADAVQIGSDPARVLIGDDFAAHPSLGIFKYTQPFYQAKTHIKGPFNWLSKVFQRR